MCDAEVAVLPRKRVEQQVLRYSRHLIQMSHLIRSMPAARAQRVRRRICFTLSVAVMGASLAVHAQAPPSGDAADQRAPAAAPAARPGGAQPGGPQGGFTGGPMPGEDPGNVLAPLVGVGQPAGQDTATDRLPAEYSRTINGVQVLQVRPDVYLLTYSGVNVAVETGWEATVVVGSGPSENCTALVDAVKAIAQAPIRYLVQTSAGADRVGCNAQLAEAGHAFTRGVLGFDALVIGHQNALFQMLSETQQYAQAALPSEVYSRPIRSMWLNDQGIQAFWMPAAHTNGDTVVLFRRSEVVVTGDVMDYWHFPVIDLQHGGSLQGEIAALNRILDELAVAVTPKWQLEGGTLIIPGRGPLCQQVDVLNYRDMVTIIRDRVQALIDQGRSLQQVQASDPARGYTTRYGSDSGAWTTRDFVAAVYRSLQSQKARASK